MEKGRLWLWGAEMVVEMLGAIGENGYGRTIRMLTAGDNNDSFALLGVDGRLAHMMNLHKIEAIWSQPPLQSRLDDDNQWLNDDAYSSVGMPCSAAGPSCRSGQDFYERRGCTEAAEGQKRTSGTIIRMPMGEHQRQQLCSFRLLLRT